MSVEQLHQEFLQSEGICTDTRRDVRGSIFFALKGENFDGNRFVEDALSKECRLAITERNELEGNDRVWIVSSALETLQQLAHYHRMQVSPRVLAITGSNGKTTTKELVAAVLSQSHSILATKGNLNNHIGVPLTLLSLKHEKVAVIEMGANHPGEISQLAGIAAPDLGLITNVGKAHLEGFGSFQGVLEAKGELYDYLSAQGGKAIIDGRDDLLLRKAGTSGVEMMVIGPDGDLPLGARIVHQTPYLEVELIINGNSHLLPTRLVGAYNLQNILLAAGVGLHFGIPAALIVKAIGGYAPQNQRSQLVDGKRNQVIMDSYNANPSSIREAVTGLLSYAHSPTMLILGDMAELGDSSIEEHRTLVSWIESLDVDRIVLVGPKFNEVCEPSSQLNVFIEMQGLEEYLEAEKPAGYQVLVKGSRKMELERILKFLVE